MRKQEAKHVTTVVLMKELLTVLCLTIGMIGCRDRGQNSNEDMKDQQAEEVENATAQLFRKVSYAKQLELVVSIATALTAYYCENGTWPEELLKSQHSVTGLTPAAIRFLSSYVSGLKDCRAWIVLDEDGDGLVENVNVSVATQGKTGKSVNVRATACVWTVTPQGDVVRSWTKGEEE